MTDTATKHFAKSLDAWIRRERLTDAQAAHYLGLSFVRLQQYLNGTLSLKPEDAEAVLEKIAHKG